MMGVAFLGIGISKGPKSPLLGFMWGNLLFSGKGQFLAMVAVAAALIVFIAIFGKELRMILFSRELASYMIPEGVIFTALLVFSAGVITVNLETVGGLLLYSLIANPAVAALRIARSFISALVLSGIFGALSTMGGFFIAYWFDLPLGACIALVSSFLVGIMYVVSRVTW